MAEILYSGRVDAEVLPQLLGACDWSQVPLLLVEQLPAHVVGTKEKRQDLLRFVPYTSTINIAEYTSGRVFQEDCELRWEKQGKEFLIVYIGSDRNESVLRDHHLRVAQEPRLEYIGDKRRIADEPGRESFRMEEKKYYLFGERLSLNNQNNQVKELEGDKSYAELRIPRILSYPITAPKRVRLVVCEYVCQETGRVEYFRFKRLEAAN